MFVLGTLPAVADLPDQTSKCVLGRSLDAFSIRAYVCINPLSKNVQLTPSCIILVDALCLWKRAISEMT